MFFVFSSRRRHTRCLSDWSSDVCSSDLIAAGSAWIGGDLVYKERIGVTHAEVETPDAFVRVADTTAVGDNSLARGRKDDVDVVLARQGGRVCALAHPC